jgi:hypothetical protein
MGISTRLTHLFSFLCSRECIHILCPVYLTVLDYLQACIVSHDSVHYTLFAACVNRVPPTVCWRLGNTDKPLHGPECPSSGAPNLSWMQQTFHLHMDVCQMSMGSASSEQAVTDPPRPDGPAMFHGANAGREYHLLPPVPKDGLGVSRQYDHVFVSVCSAVPNLTVTRRF